MKRLSCIFIVALMLLSLSACDSDGGEVLYPWEVTEKQWDGMFGSEEFRESVSKNVIVTYSISDRVKHFCYSGDSQLIDLDNGEPVLYLKMGDCYHVYFYDYADHVWILSSSDYKPKFEGFLGGASSYVEQMQELVGRFGEAVCDAEKGVYTLQVAYEDRADTKYECTFQYGRLVSFIYSYLKDDGSESLRIKLSSIGNVVLETPTRVTYPIPE